MTLSNALSNALSGLTAASRGTEVVSNNLANALTPGFARRQLELSPRNHIAGGGGVQVDGVTRFVRNGLLAQSRLAGAEASFRSTLSDHARAMEKVVGIPGEAGALTSQLADLDGALVAATARPDSEPVLQGVLDAAKGLVRSLSDASAEVQRARSTADGAIASDVRTLNEGLARVAQYNRQITAQAAAGADTGALQDQRQSLIDALSQIVPLQEYPRAGGSVALFTAAGGVLLDGSTPVRIEFAAVGPVAPQMSVENGLLATLSIDGVPMKQGQAGLYGGGRLAANFQIRDREAPALQAQLDALALDLHDRLADPSVDPTITAAGLGLLTDGGAPATVVNARGLAGRLQINEAADPESGGAVWRLRDGMGASVQGAVGDSGLLTRMRAALSAQRSAAADSAAPVRSAAVHVADLSTATASDRLQAEAAETGAAAQSTAYSLALKADGVDSDHEMQSLLELQRAYASNAKVFKAVDDMLQTILSLT